MKICMISLGCDKNLVDSEMMLGYLSRGNVSFTDDAETADVIFVNTCCFILDAKDESIQAILNTIITNIQFITSSQGSLASNVDMSKLPSVGVRMAIAIVGIIPVLVIYPFFQKYFIRGIVVGGVKG